MFSTGGVYDHLAEQCDRVQRGLRGVQKKRTGIMFKIIIVSIEFVVAFDAHDFGHSTTSQKFEEERLCKLLNLYILEKKCRT